MFNAFFKTMSLCLVFALAATLVTFSQTDKPAPVVAAAAAVTMPVERTVTDIKGRKGK